MRVYISGPIAGDPKFEEKFAAAAELVRRHGHEPVNPAEVKLTEQARPFEYLLVDLCLLAHCEAIYMLAGWENSGGAKIERAFAEYARIPEVAFRMPERAVEAPTGKWIEVGSAFPKVRCSTCGSGFPWKVQAEKACPQCGSINERTEDYEE